MVGLVPGFFFFNDTATTEIYTLSLHDALPISPFDEFCSRVVAMRFAGSLAKASRSCVVQAAAPCAQAAASGTTWSDRKSTRLNSSHANISYAVFCLKKKNTQVATAKEHRDQKA